MMVTENYTVAPVPTKDGTGAQNVPSHSGR
jgi:hypothetical protein